MLSVRTLRHDEIDQAADLTARTFGSGHEREDMFQILRAGYHQCPFMRPEDCYVGALDGRIVAKWQLLNFRMCMEGLEVPFCGVQGVAAEPDVNHKGYAKEVALKMIAANREGPFDFALGFGQRGAFYRRIGAVPVAADYDLDLDTRRIPFLHDDPFRAWDESTDLTAIIEFYNGGNRNRIGPLIRNEDLWPWLVRRPPSIYICDEGYIGVSEHENGIEIREVMGRGSAFYEMALLKLAALARERDQRRLRGKFPPDHPLAQAAIAYGATVSSIYHKKSGCLAFAFAPLRLFGRLVGKMTERLQDSRHHDAQIDLGIRCDEDDCRLLLNPEGRSSTKIDLELTAGDLLQLVFGYRSIGSVLTSGHGGSIPSGLNERSLALLEVALPIGHPFMWNSDRY